MPPPLLKLRLERGRPPCAPSRGERPAAEMSDGASAEIPRKALEGGPSAQLRGEALPPAAAQLAELARARPPRAQPASERGGAELGDGVEAGAPSGHVRRLLAGTSEERRRAAARREARPAREAVGAGELQTKGEAAFEQLRAHPRVVGACQPSPPGLGYASKAPPKLGGREAVAALVAAREQAAWPPRCPRAREAPTVAVHARVRPDRRVCCRSRQSQQPAMDGERAHAVEVAEAALA